MALLGSPDKRSLLDLLKQRPIRRASWKWLLENLESLLFQPGVATACLGLLYD